MRSGLEALICLCYITQQDSEERAILYTEFDHILAEAYAKRVDQWPDLFKDIDLKQRREDIKLNFERVKANYPVRDFWAGKIIKNGRLREMAQQVGLRWYYDFMYWFASNHAHANVRSAIEVMHRSADDRFTYNLGPSSVNTQHSLLQAYHCIVQFFKLPEEENIRDLIARYAALSEKIKWR